MPDDVHRRRRWTAVALTVTAAAAASASADAAKTASHTAAGCGGGAEATVLCLVNRQRARHGVRPLRRDRRLARAAGRHAHDMARRRYFAHARSGGPDLGTRARRAGWRGSATAEAIAWGCGSYGTPRATVRGLMASSSHRAILLSGRYGRAGAGIAGRAPVRCGGGATYVIDVGRR